MALKVDLVVIGGGIIGGGIARDATLRGLKVALFEKDDFGAGTTSRSTRLIHGGLRYLTKYEIDLVYEALRERRTLLRIAPHLVKPLPFLLPVYKGQGHSLPILWLGIATYDFMSPWRAVPHHRLLPSDHCLKLEPSLRPAGLRGGFLFYDCQCKFPERLCLENVLDAALHGAVARNHTQVVGFRKEASRLVGVRVKDQLTGQEEDVEARLVINASGPWLDETEKIFDPGAPQRLRRTKGIHLVVPKFTRHALIMETQRADRVVFAIPWGDYTLVGTTDTDYEGRNEDVRAEQEDVDYLLKELRAVLDVRIDRKEILFTTAGLRPLKRELGKSTADISRSHEIRDHGREEGLEGFLTVVGGKITTYRKIAKDVVDYAVGKLGFALDKCRTHRLPLPGGRLQASPEEYLKRVRFDAARAGLGPEVASWLAEQYGSRAPSVVDRVRKDARLGEPIQGGHAAILAEVHVAVEEEFARTLTDVLLRRVPLALAEGQGRAAALKVATEMARLLHWTAEQEDRQVAAYLDTLELMSAPGQPAAPVSLGAPPRKPMVSP